jgi:hypothetical protein
MNPDYPTPTWTRRRTGLQKVRDVMLTVMAFLVSILVIAILFFGYRFVVALADVGNRFGTVGTAPTEPAWEPTCDPQFESC